MPVCHVCQKDNPAGAEYCEDCGAALTSAGAPTPAPAAPATPAAAGSETAAGAPTPAPAAPATPAAAGSETTAGATPAAPAAPPMPDTPGETGAGPAAPPADAGGPAPTGTAETAAPDAAAPSTSGPQPATGAPAAGEQRARLVALRYGALTGEEIPLLGQRLVVGRFDPETGPVDIDLSSVAESVHISRQHGELYREADGRWTVRDLGSTNGVFVKGSADASFGPRITAPRPLSNGDELAFGNARFVFRTD